MKIEICHLLLVNQPLLFPASTIHWMSTGKSLSLDFYHLQCLKCSPLRKYRRIYRVDAVGIRWHKLQLRCFCSVGRCPAGKYSGHCHSKTFCICWIRIDRTFFQNKFIVDYTFEIPKQQSFSFRIDIVKRPVELTSFNNLKCLN